MIHDDIMTRRNFQHTVAKLSVKLDAKPINIHNWCTHTMGEYTYGGRIYRESAMNPGPRLNIKTVLSTYGDSHVKDKMADRTSYL